MTGTTTGWIWFESWPLSVCGDESRLISSRWLRFGSVWLHPSFFSETLWSGKIKNTFDNDWWCVFTTNYGAYIAWYFNHSMCIIVYISLQTMASIGKFPSLVTFQTFQVGVEWPVLLGLTIPRRPHLGSITESDISHTGSNLLSLLFVMLTLMISWMMWMTLNCWYCCRGFCPPKLFFGGLWPLDRRGMGGMGGMGPGTAENNHGSTGSGLEGWRQEVHCQLQLKDFTWHLGWMWHGPYGPWHVGLQWCSFP